jgi:hypothetical protein
MVRLADGKVEKAVVLEYVPDLYTHTHLVAVLIGKSEKVIDENSIVKKDEKDQLQ